MSFPQTSAPTVTNDGSVTDDAVCDLPGSIAEGDLLLFAFDENDASESGSPPTTPSGWVVKGSLNVANTVFYRLYARKATGSEGSTVTVTSSNGQIAFASQIYRVPAASWSGDLDDVEVSTALTGSSSTPTPNGLTVSYGAKDTLWFVFALYNDDNEPTNSYPTNYGNGVNTHAGGAANDSCSIASARRELNAETESPGALTLDGSEAWVAWTVAVRPAAAGGGGGGEPVTILEETLTSTTGNLPGFTARGVSPTLSLDGETVSIRVTLKAGSGTMTILDAYLGTDGGSDAYDFTGDEVRVTFNDGDNGDTASSGAEIVSDLISFAAVDGEKLVVAVAFDNSGGAGGSYAFEQGTGWVSYYKSGNDAATENASGYAVNGSGLSFVAKVEVVYEVAATGAGAVSAEDATASGTGGPIAAGAGAVSAGDSSATGAGGPVVAGAGAVSAEDATASGTGGPLPPSGAGAVQAEDAAAAGAGKAAIAGSGDVSAGDTAAVGAGGPIVAGAGDAQAGDAAATGAGGPVTAGGGGVSAGDAAAAGAGTPVVKSTGAVQAEDATAAGIGGFGAIRGTGAVQAEDATAAGAGAVDVAGAGDVSAEDAASAGAGGPIVTGAGDAQAGDATAEGAGFPAKVTGAGAAQAEDATAAGAGAVQVAGVGDVSAEDATAAGAGSVAVAGAGAVQAENATAAGTAAASPPIRGAGAVQAENATASGTGTNATPAHHYYATAPRTLVEIYFDDVTTRLWDGLGKLTWMGEEFTGAGRLADVSEIRNTQEVVASGLQLTLAILPTEEIPDAPDAFLNIALAEEYQGRECRIYKAIVDPDTKTLKQAPKLAFRGFLDVMKDSELPGAAVLTITVENRLVDLERARRRSYTPEDQRELWGEEDSFFDGVAELEKRQVVLKEAS